MGDNEYKSQDLMLNGTFDMNETLTAEKAEDVENFDGYVSSQIPLNQSIYDHLDSIL